MDASRARQYPALLLIFASLGAFGCGGDAADVDPEPTTKESKRCRKAKAKRRMGPPPHKPMAALRPMLRPRRSRRPTPARAPPVSLSWRSVRTSDRPADARAASSVTTSTHAASTARSLARKPPTARLRRPDATVWASAKRPERRHHGPMVVSPRLVITCSARPGPIAGESSTGARTLAAHTKSPSMPTA